MSTKAMDPAEITRLDDHQLDIVSGGVRMESWWYETWAPYTGWSYPLHITHWNGSTVWWSAPTTTDVTGAHA